jgi:hypothetical protein
MFRRMTRLAKKESEKLELSFTLLAHLESIGAFSAAVASLLARQLSEGNPSVQLCRPEVL